MTKRNSKEPEESFDPSSAWPVSMTVGSDERIASRLLDALGNLVCLCQGGKITFINPAGLRLLGAEDSNQVVGRSLSDLVHADYRDIVSNSMEHLIEDGTATPLKFVRLDDTVIDVEVGVFPFSESSDSSFMVEARDITERLRAAENIRHREERLRGILDAVAEAVITIDDKNVIRSFNRAAEGIFGYKPREVVGKSAETLIPEFHRGAEESHIVDYLGDVGRNGEATVHHRHGRRKNGSVFPMEIAIAEFRHGLELLFTGIVRDVTEPLRVEEELKRTREELERRVEERTRELSMEVAKRRQFRDKLRTTTKIVESLREAVVVMDSDFNVIDVNPAFTKISGYSPREVMGKPPPFHDSLGGEGSLNASVWKSIIRSGRWQGEFWSKRKNGEKYAEHLSISAITDETDRVIQYTAVINDVTQRKQDEERIQYQANFDTLTGLPNRALFLDRLDQALAATARTDRKLGLVFINLDGFKLINDTLGHDAGDVLLQESSSRLRECVRSGDTVARLGGDEFTVIMPNLGDSRNAVYVAQRVLDKLAEPFDVKNEEVLISGSIGITVFPDDAADVSELLKNADAAMYRAKEQGKANYQFFTADLNEQVRERLILKSGLTRALERGELALHYQPKLDIASGHITGAEALMRWNHHEMGMIRPDQFVPIMEETGQVVEVGAWALRTACLQHKAWLAAGYPSIRVAVNLSARQLRETSFVGVVEEVLKETGIKPEGLELEITESMLMSDADRCVRALNELHEMGLHVAMDDFGTGYSSLSYLKRFPIDTIKIDKSFVNDIATDQDDAEIIKTIISMGHTLNRRIVAEGVETEEQLAILRNYRCDEIQGYLFSRPLDAENATEFIKEKSAGIDRD
jgi:diguanylate cyclase (GGDEF)-like protein/PAS domain S-box-containing protein